MKSVELVSFNKALNWTRLFFMVMKYQQKEKKDDLSGPSQLFIENIPFPYLSLHSFIPKMSIYLSIHLSIYPYVCLLISQPQPQTKIQT